MKNSQVYFIHQCQIQYYDFNTTVEGQEFRFKIYSMGFDKILKYRDVVVSIQSGVYGSAQHNP
jgi:hypothetical protein